MGGGVVGGWTLFGLEYCEDRGFNSSNEAYFRSIEETFSAPRD